MAAKTKQRVQTSVSKNYTGKDKNANRRNN